MDIGEKKAPPLCKAFCDVSKLAIQQSDEIEHFDNIEIFTECCFPNYSDLPYINKSIISSLRNDNEVQVYKMHQKRLKELSS